MSYIINGIKYNAIFPPDESPNPLNVPSSFVFADELTRDTYFTINFADLVKDETYIYIENTSDLQSWSGDTEPVSYVPNWASKIGFIKGDKGDSGAVGRGVNTGGATNQVLKKLSPADYDTDWGNITNALNNSILIASGGDLADSGKRFNDLGITVADIWSANKVISQIDSQVAKTLSIEGNWNASTNTPNLNSISEGDTYIVEVAGTNYGDTYEVNDWIVKTDTGYAKINNSLATVVFSSIGGSPLDNPELVLEFDKYINKISTISTGNIPKITADGQIEDSTYSVSDLFTKDLTEYTEKTTTLSNSDKVLVFDESTGLWKYSRVDKIPSSASGTSYTNAEPSVIEVGGIPAGTTFDTVPFSDFVDLLLYPELFPNLTNPSSTFTSSITGFREIGELVNISINSSFNRGTINPQYLSDEPYRAGLPNTHIYTGSGLSNISSTSLTDTVSILNYTILSGNQSWTGRVAYDEGVQPKGSKGTDFNTPLPAGQTNITTRTITGVYPIFATTVNISTLTKQPLIANGSVITVDLVGETSLKQKIQTPDIWGTLSKIEQYNPLSSSWDTIPNASFTIVNTTQTIQGNTINYKEYTHNGALIGARRLRFTF